MFESTPEHIFDVANEALERASAPICYLHREPDGPAFAVVVEIDHWRKIMDRIPRSDAMTELAMNHGHIEGGGE